jgi:hypothetical protein
MKKHITLAALAALSLHSHVRAELTNDLVVYYSFDQEVAQKIEDRSGNTRDGTLYYAWAQGPGEAADRAYWGWTAPAELGPYFDQAGKWGMGLALQGTTFKPKLVLVAKLGRDYDGLDASNITISYWAKRESYRSANWGSKGVTTARTPGDRTLRDPLSVDWGDWSDTVPNVEYDTLQPRYGGGAFEVRMYGNASQRNFTVGGVLSGLGLAGEPAQGDDAWHHFLWEYAPDNSVTLTVDGTKVGTMAGPGWGVLPFDSIIIGEAWDTGGDMNDSLDEVAVWNRALSAAEKAYLLTHPVMPATPPPAFGTRSFAWSGASNNLPAIYVGGGEGYAGDGATYALINGRLRVASPGGQGWVNNAFDWVGPLAQNEVVAGAVTFRVNQFSNGPDPDSLGRVRLFWFNALYANGLNAFASLYASDKKMSRGSGWRPDLLNAGASSDWGKWEFNPDTAGAYAPEGHVYVYNSFSLVDPVTDPGFFRAIAKGTDHVFSWSARYLPAMDAVQVDTALDGEHWGTLFVDRGFSNLGWAENALAKQHGSMQGAWEAEFTQINWNTTTAAAVADSRNYWWQGRVNVGEGRVANHYPPLYVGGTNQYQAPSGWYSLSNGSPVLSVGMNPAEGWRNNAFDWTGKLADGEKISGSLTFLIDYFTNGAAADSLGRVRLLWFNAPYGNGLNAFASLYASDKLMTLSQSWTAGGHPDWNKWEFNPDRAGALAPEGRVYVYNSFNLKDPATDDTFFKAISLDSPHTFSWSAEYVRETDVVRVTTALDGEPWTETDIHRGYNNLGWAENALVKQHGSMRDGAWSAGLGVLTWTTTAGDPGLVIQRLSDGKVQLTWPGGALLEADSLAGPWTTRPVASPYVFAPAGQKFYKLAPR